MKVDEDDEKAQFMAYKQHIVARCLIKKKGLNDATWASLLQQDEFLNMCYLLILSNSISPVYVVSRKKAETIYYIYKSMNYAKEYFTAGKVNKIQEFSFNAYIHNCGVEKENKLAREAQLRAKHGR